MVAAQPDQPQGVPVAMTDLTTRLSEDDNLRAAEYALGVLQGEARRAFAQRLSDDTLLAAAVRQWDEQFVAMAADIAPVAPPQSVEVAIQKLLFAVASDAAARQNPSLWNSLNFWRGLAVASILGTLALGSLMLRAPTQPDASGLVAQVVGETNAVKLVAYYDAAKGELRLNRTEGAAVTGRSLELWLIAGQDAPVSLGLLPTETAGKLLVPATLRGKLRGGVLAISDEPKGGSPTGAPTGAVLATGSLTAI
jgi:anti-sigma-K factor RskA